MARTLINLRTNLKIRLQQPDQPEEEPQDQAPTAQKFELKPVGDDNE